MCTERSSPSNSPAERILMAIEPTAPIARAGVSSSRKARPMFKHYLQQYQEEPPK